MKFTYSGHDKDGATVRETVEATDRFAVYDIARGKGHVVDALEDAKSFSLRRFFNIEKIEYAISRVKEDELVMVTRNIGSMLVAGLPLSRCLNVIERQTKNPRLKLIVRDIIARINRGEQFGDTLAEYPRVFSDLYVAMVRAGSESGNLADTLKTLSVQMERSTSLKKKIKGAMIYPAIVITILIIIGILMMIFVMPSITSTFESLNVKLPATTQFLITVSKFMSNHTLVALGALLGFIVLAIMFLRSKAGKVTTSWLFPRLPVIGTMAKETNAARTARTLASLLASGVDVIRSLQITSEVVQNVYYRAIIIEAMRRVEKGEPLSGIFVERNDLYPILVGEMILVGEETGNISEMLGQLAVFYEGEVEQKTKDLSTIIEPILMVVIGGTVGFFALAMISPIYSIGNSIG